MRTVAPCPLPPVQRVACRIRFAASLRLKCTMQEDLPEATHPRYRPAPDADVVLQPCSGLGHHIAVGGGRVLVVFWWWPWLCAHVRWYLQLDGPAGRVGSQRRANCAPPRTDGNPSSCRGRLHCAKQCCVGGLYGCWPRATMRGARTTPSKVSGAGTPKRRIECLKTLQPRAKGE